MSTNGLIASCQSGFMAHHSTTTALLKCTDNWLNGIDAGKYAGVVFVDLKKAFDTVDHGILAHYGVQGHELDWFKAYLSKRTQFIRVNGCDSRIQSISLGVPQGSCLGPLLFSVYINDLPMVINNAKVYVYADDTCMSFQADSVSKLNEGLNKDLEVMAFKSLNRLTPQYLSDLFVANSTNPSYNLRSTDTDLTLPKRNTSTGLKCFSYRGAKL